MIVDEIINEILKREGDRYTNDPNDSGGPTKWGVTQKNYSIYLGRPATVYDVMNMTREDARRVYLKVFYTDPGFDKVAAISPVIAEELTDTGVNCGQGVAIEFLQRVLNAFNLRGARYPDIPVDRECGPRTRSALQAFLKWRGHEGVGVIMKSLNSLQVERYIDLAERRQKDEDYVYGWILQRG